MTKPQIKQRVFVTGGSRGIGRAIVSEFLTRDFDVVFTCRKITDDITEWCARQQNEGRPVRVLAMNLLDVQEIQSVLNQEIGSTGGFQVVVHNAATCSDVPLMMMEDEQWWSVLNTTLNSFYYVNKLVLPAMVRARYGRIIGIASVSGESGNRGQANYAAAKGALIAGMKSLAKEVASRGITVNIVSPGIIDTDMTKDLPVLEHIKLIVPSGRVGRPEEVAKAVAFLGSQDASYIVGEVLRVNGGLYT
ncbi:MAG: SDR family NAD(P)-dependent oxidoreductase [Proteobacteria bacterium]|nr:SDR family NAD(P)-dependent oxidoreductase [Pseudomonadota bacterium]